MAWNRFPHKLTISPLARNGYINIKYEQRCIEFADEVRIVADGDVSDFCALIEENIQATRYYLSPCEINGKMNLLETITQLGLLNQRPNKPKWLLSVQTHKLIGIA